MRTLRSHTEPAVAMSVVAGHVMSGGKPLRVELPDVAARDEVGYLWVRLKLLHAKRCCVLQDASAFPPPANVAESMVHTHWLRVWFSC